MLRKTKDGRFERQDASGAWVAVSAEEADPALQERPDGSGVATMIDDLVAEMHNGVGPGAPEIPNQPVQEQAPQTPSAASADEAMDVEPVAGDFDLEVPGLVSGDSGRSSRGFKTVRERLKDAAKKRREPRRVEVGAAAAKVTGPAKSEGTEKRQQRRATERAEAGKKVDEAVAGRQRYVQRAAPSLFSDRPKWVAELFEAHFRSEHTLAMRRKWNRMKISRQDYAIGWLTAFDKFREESSLLRLKDRGE